MRSDRGAISDFAVSPALSTRYSHQKSTAILPPVPLAGVNHPLTYAEYLVSPVETARYDILNGNKVYRRYGSDAMTSPSRLHQVAQGNLYLLLRGYASVGRVGQALMARCDVLISTDPLRVRQPDVLLISRQRLDRNPPAHEPSPLSPSPELVAEIISPSDRPGVLAAKLADYRTAEVREVWVVNMEAKTIEVVALSSEAIESMATYRTGQTVSSVTFPGLVVSVDAVFEA